MGFSVKHNTSHYHNYNYACSYELYQNLSIEYVLLTLCSIKCSLGEVGSMFSVMVTQQQIF